MDEESKQILRETSVEEINQGYRDHQMSVARRNALLREKAKLNIEEVQIGKPGAENDFAHTWLKLSTENMIHGWDNVKEAAVGVTSDPKKRGTLQGEAWHQFYYAGLGLVGAMQAGFAPLNAYLQLTGETIRRMAVNFGAPPGLAHFLGMSAEIAASIPLTGGANQIAAKGVQMGAKAGVLGKNLYEIATQAGKGAKQLEMTGFGNKLAGELIKPGATKASAMEAAFEAMQADKTAVKAADEFALQMQHSQMELPFRNIIEGLAQDGVEVAPEIAQAVKAETAFTAGSKVQLLHDPARQGVITGVEKTNSAGTRYLQIKEPHGGSTGYINSFVPEDQLVSVAQKVVKATSGESFSLEVARHAKGITIDEAKGEVPKLAARLGIDLSSLKNVTPGGRLDPRNDWYENPKKMYGYLKALEGRVDQIGPLAKQALEGNEADKMAFAKYVSELFTGPQEGNPQYTQGFMKMLMHWDPENIGKGDVPQALNTFAYDMWYAHEELGKKSVASIITGSQGSADLNLVYRTARTLYLNALLPFSVTSAFVGNSYAMGMAVAERATGALFSLDKSSGYVPREALQMTKGMVWSTMDAVKAYADAYRRVNGLRPRDMGRFSDLTDLNTAGRIINIPMDTVMGMDNFFNVWATRASHYATALRNAEHAAIPKNQMGAYVKYYVEHPTTEMLTEAKTLAEKITFQTQMGEYASQIANVLQRGPGILYFPFMRSAINLNKYSWERTPGLQLISRQLYKDIAAGGPAADAAIGRLILSQLMAQTYLELAKEGLITGSGPVDPAVLRSWKGKYEPYSAAGKTGWVPLNNIEPANTTPGIIADIASIMDNLDDPSSEQAFMAISFAIMKNMASNTWWQSADRIFDVVQHIEKGEPITEAGWKTARSPITGALSGVARITRAIDPISREARNFADELRGKFPWSSKDVPPVVDSWGDPRVPPQAFGGPWFGLLRPAVPAFRPYETDRLKKEAARLGVKMPAFTDHLNGHYDPSGQITAPRGEQHTGILLDPKQVYERTQIYRNLIRSPKYGIEAGLFDNPNMNYNSAGVSDEFRRAEQEQRYQQMWDASGQALMIKHPDLGERVMRSNFDAIEQILDYDKREEARSRMEEGIKNFNQMAPEAQRNLERWGILGNDLPDNVTYGTPLGPLINIKEVPKGTPGATPEGGPK